MRGFCVEGVRKMWVTGSALWLRVRRKAALGSFDSLPSSSSRSVPYPPPFPSPPLAQVPGFVSSFFSRTLGTLLGGVQQVGNVCSLVSINL